MQTPMLSSLTTMQVGGHPAELIEVGSRKEIIDACLDVWSRGDDWLLLGGGSNIVAADELADLHVIQIKSFGIERKPVAGGEIWRVQAGENWDALVAASIEAGLAGIEALSGIPGLVGASPIQNIGAYGQEVSQTIRRIEFLDYQTHEVVLLEGDECGFAYRDSIFKRGRLGAVLWVEFELTAHDGLSAPIEGRQVSSALEVEIGAQVPLAKIRETVLALRASKGMVLDPADRDTASCGSFFTNPIVTDRFAATLPSDAPFWDVDEDGKLVKLSAAWLIEQAGVRKGFSLPGSKAAISGKHSLAITNRGGATAFEVLQLASYVQVQVSNRFGINLVPEPNLIGFEL